MSGNTQTSKKSSSSRKISVLIVEDEEAGYILLREILKSLNVKVHRVSDGSEAVNFILLNPDIDLILMDIKLPQMDGYEATRKIKKINPGIKIIAQTAYAMLGDKGKALLAGCDDYIPKPLDAEKLKEAILKHLPKN